MWGGSQNSGCGQDSLEPHTPTILSYPDARVGDTEVLKGIYEYKNIMERC